MRQWNVHPRIMCDQHLKGEHLEMHMFIGSIKRGTKMHGYIKNNELEPLTIKSRHDELVEEMQRRGMSHKSPINDDMGEILHILLLDTGHTKEEIFKTIDTRKSLDLLISRCKECKVRYEKWKKQSK